MTPTQVALVKFAASIGLVCSVPVAHQAGVKQGVAKERKAAKAKPAARSVAQSAVRPPSQICIDVPISTAGGSPWSIDPVTLPDLTTFAEATTVASLQPEGGLIIIDVVDGGGGYWPAPLPPVTPPGIPEGHVWAYMLFGFGFVGAAARWRRAPRQF